VAVQTFGILNLSEKRSGAPIRLVLCAGLEQTSVNFLNTPVSYPRPWCRIYETSDLSQNPDQILKTFSSPRSELSSALDREDHRTAKMNFGSSTETDYPYYAYPASFHLQVRNGQVYYLIKITRTKTTQFQGKGEDLKAEMGSLRH
jgi:hypothetical protein